MTKSDNEDWEMEKERWYIKNDYFKSEMQKSSFGQKYILENGSLAIKSMLLLNGGAAISMLAFIGSVAGKNPEAINISVATNSLLLFGFGAFASVCCAVVSYISQLAIHDLGRAHRLWRTFGIVCLVAAILIAGVSLSFFMFGLLTASNAFG